MSVRSSHQQLDQIVYGHDAAHAAVFVDDDRKILPRGLHAVKQLIRRHAFRREYGGLHRAFQNVFPRLIFQTKVNFRIQNADHVVRVLAAHRVVGMIILVEGISPFLFGIRRE